MITFVLFIAVVSLFSFGWGVVCAFYITARESRSEFRWTALDEMRRDYQELRRLYARQDTSTDV